ncbi:MAG: TRCF domain-containing protein, partial [Acidimicrobiia bacterium]
NLGSGFELAMRDLEIRGAGSILSETQSGHIAAVGFDLYAELVADAVSELMGGEVDDQADESVRIDLMVDAHLPVEYVAGGETRIEAYRRLAGAIDDEAIDDVEAEWLDRFGPLPQPALELIDLARLRRDALRLGITEILQNRREVKIAPVTLKASEEVRLGRIARGSVLRGATLYLRPPDGSPTTAIRAFLRTMWPPSSDTSETP